MDPPTVMHTVDAVDQCHHCERSRKLRLCRCCGRVFCRYCTSKFYIAAHLREEEKPGLDHVCFGCLHELECVQNDTVRHSRRHSYSESIQNPLTRIHPPRSKARLEDDKRCTTCARKVTLFRKHPCHLCKDVFCHSCVIQVPEIPLPYFEWVPSRKEKPPYTVCNECDFEMVRYLRHDVPQAADMPTLHRNSVVDIYTGYDSDASLTKEYEVSDEDGNPPLE